MKLSVVLLILAAGHSALAQEPFIICEYFNYIVNGTDTYACHLRVLNPNGTEFSTIAGDHLEGMTNDDVRSLIVFSGSSTIVPQVICSQFPNTEILDLSFLSLTTITASSFSGCRNVRWLRLYYNHVNSLPADTFANNQGLTHLDIDSLGLTAIPETLFAPLVNLETLEMASNNVGTLPSGLFNGLTQLHTLYLSNLHLTDLDETLFEPLTSLNYLTIFNNLLTTIPERALATLTGLTILDVGDNDFGDRLPSAVFANLTNLNTLSMSRIGVTRLDPQWFASLRSLHQLSLTLNNIDELPVGVFSSLGNIERIGLWGNRIKTLDRDAFGPLDTLKYLDLDGNLVNALDPRFFDDATNLTSLYFADNLCATGYFFSFQFNREIFLVRLGRCLRNFGFTVDMDTDTTSTYDFFSAPNPGIAIRVTSDENIHIALTPFNFPWSPMLEIFIGTANNTRSVIRRNQETDVVVVPTPGILRRGEFTGFRIVWANHMVLTFREGEQWPFMVYTMQDFFNVNFYGLRSPTSQASWSIQPIDREDLQSP